MDNTILCDKYCNYKLSICFIIIGIIIGYGIFIIKSKRENYKILLDSK